MCEEQTKGVKANLPDWDYKENLYLEPCECNHECGNHILNIKGEMAHVKCNPNEFVDIASLSIDDLYDLYWNVVEKLDIEWSRIDLDKQFKKEENK